jgi:hypothetical protein
MSVMSLMPAFAFCARCLWRDLSRLTLVEGYRRGLEAEYRGGAVGWVLSDG